MPDLKRRRHVRSLEEMRSALRLALEAPADKQDERVQIVVEDSLGKMAFSSGTYVCRMGGVSATATSGRAAAARAWLRQVERKLQGLRAS